jgi:hypothetical protein
MKNISEESNENLFTDDYEQIDTINIPLKFKAEIRVQF